MRIGIDGTSWFNGRGYGRYTRELLTHLFALETPHTFQVFVEAEHAASFGELPPHVSVRPVDTATSQTSAASADGYRSPGDLLRMSKAVRQERPDVMFFPTVYTYFPLPPGVRGVITIHDAIVERFPKLTMPNWRARLFWKVKVRLALQQCAVVLTVSDFAKSDLERHLGVAAERMFVTGEAPAAIYRPGASKRRLREAARAQGLPDGAPWFTYVGGFNPHKRIDVLLEAHGRVAKGRDVPPHLLLVGSLTSDVFHARRDALTAQIERLGTTDLVHWTGFVADDELAVLHEGALANVLPSECEGFGLPAVEAAASGTAVIATNQSPLPALLEGGGLFIDPGDVDALAAAMATLLDDDAGRARMASTARERAAAMCWVRAAREALRAVEAAA